MRVTMVFGSAEGWAESSLFISERFSAFIGMDSCIMEFTRFKDLSFTGIPAEFRASRRVGLFIVPPIETGLILTWFPSDSLTWKKTDSPSESETLPSRRAAILCPFERERVTLLPFTDVMVPSKTCPF